MAKKKANPHCPVPGCQTKRPHLADPIMQGIHREFSDPKKIAMWFKVGIAELRASMQRDLEEGRIFAYLARWRQPEEIYCRALYALFIAKPEELPHLFSGEMPNGFRGIYRAVNKTVFEGRGILETPQPGLSGGEFTTMDMLNTSAHASFPLFITAIGIARNPACQTGFPKHIEHLQKYCNYLNYMEGMFNAGKPKEHVLQGVRNLHKPASAWKQETAPNQKP
ncbi:MAG: hypothetical protein DMG48_05435 [Acidobacteria bacterium]|nr:MAG: hypothetical protein DMG48_05435 [Acidobacteriota bacterium]